MSTTLPPISTLPTLPVSSRAAVLDLLFEPCTQLHTLSVSMLHDKSFASYDELAAAVGAQLIELFESGLKSDQDWLDVILNAHPRLGEKKVESELSRLEQAAMNRGGGGGVEAGGGLGGTEGPSKAEAAEAEAEELRRLNAQYEAVFEGLRYVVFVNGRSRRVIMEDMERRIKRGDPKQEKLDAIQAMCDIAADRAKKLLPKSEAAVLDG